MPATKSKAKFKVGDWIVADRLVWQKVVAVIEEHEIIYGLTNLRTRYGRLGWQTEHEMLKDAPDIHAGTPDFDRFAKLKVGDTLRLGDSDDAKYSTVLARVGDALLFSETPKDRDVMEAITSIGEQIAQMTGQQVMGPEDKAKLRDSASATQARRRTGGWNTTEHACLMNWKIIGE